MVVAVRARSIGSDRGPKEGRTARTFSVSGASAMRCTRNATSMTTSGGSSGGSPIDQLRYEVWLQVGQSTETSARTRGGCSSPGRL